MVMSMLVCLISRVVGWDEEGFGVCVLVCCLRFMCFLCWFVFRGCFGGGYIVV